MNRPALFAAVLALAPALHALELTPTESYRELEGFKVPVVTFKDAGRILRWQPPAGWQLSSSDARLHLTSAERAQATIEFKVLPRPPQGRDALPTPEHRQAWTRGFLPREASALNFKAENPSPFTFLGLPSIELLWDYAFQARRFETSISFVDLNERERLVLLVTARQADFEKVREVAMSSMFSWQTPE